jgi:3'(2'), 5'-bisphosphate nucleotidase
MESLLEVAKAAVREAGAAIMELYGDSKYTTKKDGTPVTEADKIANEVLFKHLTKTQIPILSEESDGMSLPYPQRLWVIDPIDGTSGFIKHEGDFTVMIGLLHDGRPIIGVVYTPVTGNMYYAENGLGAFVENGGTRTKLVTSQTSTAPLRFVCSKTHFTPFKEKVSEKLGAMKLPCGGMGTKVVQIAENTGDFTFTRANLGEWDVCAPTAILEEAGGRVTDVHGMPIQFGNENHTIQHGVIFSNGICHEKIVVAIQEVTREESLA